MNQKNKILKEIIPYFGITIFIIILFLYQLRSPQDLIIIILISYTMIFIAASELINFKAGIFTALFIILFQLYNIESSADKQSYPFLLIAVLQTLVVGFYFLLNKFRKIRIEKIQERVIYFHEIINASPQPLLLKDKNGKILFASKSIMGLLGLKNNLSLEDNIKKYIHPEDQHRHDTLIQRSLITPNEIQSSEFRIKKGSKWIWVRNDSINLLENKHVKALVTSLQDISLQKNIDTQKAELFANEKNARAIAEKAIRDRDEFLSIASHELRTPLTTVLLQLQATLRKISTQSLADFSGSDLLNSLQIAEKQSRSLATLIKDLLNISLATTGRFTINKERIDLVKITDSLIKRYEEEIKLSGCDVRTDIIDSEIIGMWDPVRVEQAIINLFMNALKYAKGKNINIIIKKEQGWVILSVKDHGPGIAEKHLSEIFEPFIRINTGSYTKGLGVGLFIAKQIAKAHGGDIDVESEVGKGSTFTLKLPLTN
jgi:PAS domain S-box-containing protein